ncbi:unnamed protein product [Owenia fusiformis]|uniref:Uncharacterized protein n=1 Tax=Owenia fusiformis TaxID=6347 RepID=A0A8J1TH82_OWEFU|nr:unnamed protein product [Owenia fusiformis]
MENNRDEDVDFDFFDSPKHEKRVNKHEREQVDAPKNHKSVDEKQHGHSKKKDKNSKSYSSDSDSYYSDTPRSNSSSVKKIEAKVPTSKNSNSSRSSDSFQSTSDETDQDEKRSTRPKTANVSRRKTRGKTNGQSSNSERERKYSDKSYSDESESYHPRHGRRQSKDDYSESDSDTSSTSYTTSDEDVTDVSPLGSPDVSPVGSPSRKFREEYSPQSRGSSKSGRPDNGRNKVQYSDSEARKDDLKHLLASDPDGMDLKLLMRAILEMDEERQQTSEHPKSRKVLIMPPKGASDRNFSFENNRVREIDRENERLLNEIMKRNKPKPRKKLHPAPPPVKRVTHTTVNRQREQRKIEQQNLAMMKRLQTVKATKGMSRNEQLHDFDRQMTYGVPLFAWEKEVERNHRDVRRRPKETPFGSEASLPMGSRTQSMNSLRSHASSGTKSMSNMSSSGKRSRPQSAKYRSIPEWDENWQTSQSSLSNKSITNGRPSSGKRTRPQSGKTRSKPEWEPGW